MRSALTERVKDGLVYKDTFDGRQAIDKIAYIIKITDRNLALLLGRVLDAQSLFHDHCLRESAADVYQFKTRIPSPFAGSNVPCARADAHAHALGKLIPPARPTRRSRRKAALVIADARQSQA